MKEKILSIISLVTIFVPLTMLFVWKPTAAKCNSYCYLVYGVFIVASFLYALFLFLKKQQRDIYVKVGLGVNAFYLLGILFMVIIPRLF